ncbi:GNAT family N-acetyltransferase [Ornithinibacillus californiensis]|uniref:GNAT family N-acetyltransferase n=1 Tax=Ornithinibacillus californiensis TaxID=161536 RepID=UPI00064DEB25|nr:GNAT family N-acetyltransferase [Ornithinibacillus californiensis]
MNIRKAVLTDAAGIAKVHVNSWRTTYKGIIPASFLDNLSYDKRTELWQRNISREDNYVFVAETENKEIVGFADCGKREDNHIANSGDLTSIYLLEEYQGKGIGKGLMKQLFRQFKELGYERVFVEVLDENNTRNFYEYYGAKLLKSEKIKMAGVVLDLLIYEWNDLGKVLSDKSD